MGYNNKSSFSLLWACRQWGSADLRCCLLAWSLALVQAHVCDIRSLWGQPVLILCDCRNARGQPSFPGSVHSSHCFMVVNILLAKASHRSKAQITARKWRSSQHKARARVGKYNSASVERSIAGWRMEHSFLQLLMPCHRWVKKVNDYFQQLSSQGKWTLKLVHDLKVNLLVGNHKRFKQTNK